MEWTGKVIREEMARLDGITGLRGREVPICFFYKKSGLEAGFMMDEGQPVAFLFNKCIYDSRKYEDRLLMAVVRHEYAHYMDLMRSGPTEVVHGEGWEACCRAVGAITREEQVIMFCLQNNPKPTAEDLRKPERLVRLIRKHPYFSRKAATA